MPNAKDFENFLKRNSPEDAFDLPVKSKNTEVVPDPDIMTVFSPGRIYDTNGKTISETKSYAKKPNITIDNFFVSSFGVWDEIEEIPEGFTSIFKSNGKNGSEYFTNEEVDTVIRVSDHWGYGIRNCCWHLKMLGDEKNLKISCSKFAEKFNGKMFIGMISIDNLWAYSKPTKNTVKKTCKKKSRVSNTPPKPCDHWGAKLVDGIVEVYNKQGDILRSYELKE